MIVLYPYYGAGPPPWCTENILSFSSSRLSTTPRSDLGPFCLQSQIVQIPSTDSSHLRRTAPSAPNPKGNKPFHVFLLKKISRLVFCSFRVSLRLFPKRTTSCFAIPLEPACLFPVFSPPLSYAAWHYLASHVPQPESAAAPKVQSCPRRPPYPKPPGPVLPVQTPQSPQATVGAPPYPSSLDCSYPAGLKDRPTPWAVQGFYTFFF